ncbi:MAG: glycoside hydrolase family 4 [Paenibacillaceae bacterium]|jgi:alpha-galactosidase|nr:glycoside hydrolase family 4 [Paenibacillaceae bacterium]
MKELTVTVIGGGSVNWMQGLMRDFYMIDSLHGGEIRLVDPNREHVEAVADMLLAFNKLRDKNYRIRIMEDRREALHGTDFVIATFSPGAMEAFRNDLELPLKYGVRLPVSMTVGPCGISASLRTAPAAYEIVQEMEELCPGAWLLNLTNPMSVVTRAMNAAARTVKVVGLCHEFHCLPDYLGPMLGLHKPEGMSKLDYIYRWLPEQGMDYTVAGVNHFIWLTEARLNGEDMLPLIREYCRTHPHLEAAGGSGEQATASFRNNGAAKFALCRQFGCLPLAGDRHLIEFYPSLCNIRNGYGMKYNVSKTTVEARQLSKIRQLEKIRSMARQGSSIIWEKSGEELTAIMEAVISGQSVSSIVNMPNRGQIANLPQEVIVETLATVSAEGIVPKPSGALPGAIGSLCRLHADVHEITLKAALQGSRELLIEALSLDPSSGCADFAELPQLADELLLANRKWLPRFFGEGTGQ